MASQTLLSGHVTWLPLRINCGATVLMATDLDMTLFVFSSCTVQFLFIYLFIYLFVTNDTGTAKHNVICVNQNWHKLIFCQYRTANWVRALRARDRGSRV